MRGTVGRERELLSVETFLDDVRSGPGIFLIEGEAGIGKTTVLREALERARARGFDVLACQPVEAETKLSHASIADLLGDVDDTLLAALPDPQAHALGVALLREEPEEAPPDQRAIGTAVGALLARLAERRPVLVAVDDVQWLDRPSAAALTFAARRLDTQPLGLLLVRRTGSGAELPLERSVAGGPMRIVLDGLSVASLFHILRDQLGEELSRPALLKIQEASGGNPLYALELARSLLDSGSRAGEPLPVPDTLAGLVAERLARVPDAASEALLVAAASSTPTLSLIEEVVGGDAAGRLAPAEEAGVVSIDDERIRFTHPLYASAVYSASGSEARRQVHAELAAAVQDPEERARHLALSSPAPSEEVASVLDGAASRARARGAPEAAAELGEMAAKLTPEDDAPSFHRRTIAAAESLVAAGDPERARGLVEPLLDEQPADAERGRALQLLGQVRWFEDSFPDAIRLLEEALEYLDDPRLTVPTRLDLSFAYISAAQPAAAEEHAARGLEDAERLGEPGLLAEALAVAAMIGFMVGRGTDGAKLERSLELEDRRRPTQLIMRPSSIAAMIAVYEARLSEGCERLYELRRWGYERGEESALPFLLDHLAWAEWWRGEFDASLRATEEAIRLSAQAGSKTHRTAPLVHRAIVRGLRGDIDAALDDIAAATALFQEIGWVFGLSWAATAAGAIRVASGDAAAAEEALRPLIEATEATGVLEPVWTYFLPDAVEALTALGEIERAERLRESFEAQAAALDRPWALAEAARCRALVLAEVGDLDGALAAVEDAVERHETLELPVERGRALLALGKVRRRRREKLLARDALQDAEALFEDLGANLWAEQARLELGRVGLRRGSPSKLTATEQRVAELAAAGRTSKEVAQILSVSPKTVEANLSRIYGKLGIHSRAELGAWMAKQAQQTKT